MPVAATSPLRTSRDRHVRTHLKSRNEILKMSNMEYTITRETDDASTDIVVNVEYTYSAYGIDFSVSDGVELDQYETDCLYTAIVEEEGNN